MDLPRCLQANICTMVQGITTKYLAATGKFAKSHDTQALPNSHTMKNKEEIMKENYFRSIDGMLLYIITIKVYSLLERDTNKGKEEEKEKNLKNRCKKRLLVRQTYLRVRE